MAIEDWIPDFDPLNEDCLPTAVECRDCGRQIMWAKAEHSMRWIPLDDTGQRHRCPAKVSPAREFPKLEDE
jgi:hypothetical protein